MPQHADVEITDRAGRVWGGDVLAGLSGSGSYLGQPFAHDIFASFSHGSRRDHRVSPLKEWSQSLISNLGDHIRAMSPEFDSLNIWADEVRS